MVRRLRKPIIHVIYQGDNIARRHITHVYSGDVGRGPGPAMRVVVKDRSDSNNVNPGISTLGKPVGSLGSVSGDNWGQVCQINLILGP